MKRLILIILTLTALATSRTARADNYYFNESDKQTHMITAFALTTTGYLIASRLGCESKFCRIVVPILIVNALGGIKELLIDAPHGDARDCVANGIGSLTAGAFLLTIEF